jgi:hypothetical protein
MDASDSDLFLRFLDAAAIEDERLTAEEEVAVADVEADRVAGVPTIPFETIKRAYSS